MGTRSRVLVGIGWHHNVILSTDLASHSMYVTWHAPGGPVFVTEMVTVIAGKMLKLRHVWGRVVCNTLTVQGCVSTVFHCPKP
jgi:hypothetical protein